MSGLPDVLKIPDGPEKLSIPAGDLPVSALIKLKLPPQRASSIYTHPTDYLSELAPTITTFNAAEIALGRAILLDPELQSIELVHSLSQGSKDRYPLWLATIWSLMERVREARALWRPAVQQVTESSHSIHTQSAVGDEDWYSDLSGKVPGGQMGAAQMCSATNGDPGQAYSRGSVTIWRLDPKLLSVNIEELW
ncbi:hypothetical protein DFH09DRAFT_1079640 [Mycena vulgaris]|nr:hypothetical protein DFH09DRAFT_1079640 [Mycena vulgaris]